MSKSSQHSTISPITMVMIPQEEWQSLNDKLDQLVEMIETRNTSDRDTEWLESEAAASFPEPRPRHGRTTATSAPSPSPKSAVKSTSTAPTSTPSYAHTALDTDLGNEL